MPNPSSTIFRVVDRSGRGLLILAALSVLVFMLAMTKLDLFSSFILLCFVVGVINPWWGLTAVAILGPLDLLGPGATHRIVHIEPLVLGVLVGFAARRPIALRRASSSSGGGPIASRDPDVPAPPAALWPCLGWILAFGVLASVLPGFQVGFASHEPVNPIHRLYYSLAMMFYGYPTWPWWAPRAAYNWITGLLLAWVVYHVATPQRVRRFFVYAGVILVVGCLVGLGNRFHIWSLDSWRRPNPDVFLHRFHRLMGLAGHPGWMGEWIVLTWPGLLLLWGPGRKRKLLVAGSLAIVGLTLLLTMARAAWLGVGLAVVALVLANARTFRVSRRVVAAACVLFVLIAGIGLLAAPRSLLFRFEHLTDIRDRLNYFASTYHLLRLFPLGAGLAMHSLYYDALFSPFDRFWQFDHTTAHNTWLNVLVEQGPFQMLFLAVGAALLLWVAWRAWRRADPVRQPLLLCLLLVLLGIAVESMAQYLPLIRAVEVMIWIYAGCILRLSRDVAAEPNRNQEEELAARNTESTETTKSGEDAESAGSTEQEGRNQSESNRPSPVRDPSVFVRARPWSAALLLAGAVPALVVGAYHARRDAAHPFPRALVLSDKNPPSVATWTAGVWRFPLEPDWCGIEFNLTASRYPQDVEILLPDNAPYKAHFKAGEQRGFWFAFRPSRPANAFTPLRWMEIRCAHTWTPALSDPGKTDRRRLGIYVFGLRPFYCDSDPRRPKTQKWTESTGGMVPMLPAPGGS